MKTVVVVFEEAIVTLNESIAALIDKYGLEFTPRQSLRQGIIVRHEFEIECDTVMQVADDFIKAGFGHVSIEDAGLITIEQ